MLLFFFPPFSRTVETKRLKLKSGRLDSEEAVLTGYVGEAAEGVGAAGRQTGAQLWSSAHRVGHHLSGELWIDVLEVSRASLKKRNEETQSNGQCEQNECFSVAPVMMILHHDCCAENS